LTSPLVPVASPFTCNTALSQRNLVSICHCHCHHLRTLSLTFDRAPWRSHLLDLTPPQADADAAANPFAEGAAAAGTAVTVAATAIGAIATAPAATSFMGGGGGGRQDMRPGDWICPSPECANLNFASRMVCRRCTMTRPGVDPVVARQNPNTHQPSHGHGGQQGGQGQGAMGGNVRPGDWMCPRPDCRNHNFASRDVCRMCPEPRPMGGGGAPGGYGGQQGGYGGGQQGGYGGGQQQGGFHGGRGGGGANMRPGDWMCPRPDCSNHNFASRDVCRMCPEPRPAPVGGGGGSFLPQGGGQSGPGGPQPAYGYGGGGA
jgi:hypothetical protein